MAINFKNKPTKLQKQVAIFQSSARAEVTTGPVAKLPGMIREAAKKLQSAVSAAEVLEAKAIASATYTAAQAAARLETARGAHDKVVAEAHRAQASALMIEAEAKTRLADEYDAAQARGEVGKKGQRTDLLPEDKKVPTAEQAGLSRREVMEFRETRDLQANNPAAMTDALSKMLKDGDEPTRAALKRKLAPIIKEIRAEKQEQKKAKRVEREVVLAEKIRALPDQKFGVILADPEWEFETYSAETGMDRAAANHYPTSPTEEIGKRDVPSIAAKDCVLFLWATAPGLLDALEVMKEWGFTYKSQFVWVKDKLGTGYWNRNRHELLLVGTKGDIPAPAMGEQWESVIEAPVGEHSAKPEKSLELIEAYYPNIPKIELNRRGPARRGWAAWGNEAGEAA